MTGHSTSLAEAERFIHGPGLSEALEELARVDPQRPYLKDRQGVVSVGELNRRVDDAVTQLRGRGAEASSRIAIALPTEAEQVVLIFAVLRLGALWIPLNPQLIGEPLRHQLRDSGATAVVTEASGSLAEQLGADAVAGPALPGELGEVPVVFSLTGEDDARGDDSPRVQPAGDRKDACLLMYTSGTTGPPKGALVSETMLRAAVLGAIEVTTPRPGDVFYVWEPLFHIGGAQVVFLPLFRQVTLALAPKFSASRFWQDVADFGVTHIHYLGGVLQILLQLPVTAEELDNRVRIAWGAGATPEVRAACHERYDFALHECYGMTETSSIVTVNRNEVDGGVGRPLPWVEIATDPAESGASPGSSGSSGGASSAGDGAENDSVNGEVRVRGRVPGLLTAGYLGNPDASEKARDGEWFRTGDLGYLDRQGRLHFAGRGSDSIRVRGENVSAWQIESVFGLHPDVDRCAVVGVEAQVGEQEMLLVLTAAEGRQLDPRAILAWGESRLARFQVPRYARVVDEMPLTPSQRIAKHRLPRDLGAAVSRTA
ncbi:ATP-dependent acyl-CoA ligase [Kocuria coralli]|uniref:ATP-dependent acyl-CoA ligase n=1 Tax=Kocuria coralli TaxID=1461025 RepID=A0A5J5KYA6_9MICC|nr:AMP-binding protein [Kocuria coralli]KAA9394634.1 ATP-dependent acyl-CoA ligase [Kocuria coralli]